MLCIVSRERQRARRRIDSAKNLGESTVIITQRRMCRVLAIVVLLELKRQSIAQVPGLVRERALLRDYQQADANELHQGAHRAAGGSHGGLRYFALIATASVRR